MLLPLFSLTISHTASHITLLWLFSGSKCLRNKIIVHHLPPRPFPLLCFVHTFPSRALPLTTHHPWQYLVLFQEETQMLPVLGSFHESLPLPFSTSQENRPLPPECSTLSSTVPAGLYCTCLIQGVVSTFWQPGRARAMSYFYCDLGVWYNACHIKTYCSEWREESLRL